MTNQHIRPKSNNNEVVAALFCNNPILYAEPIYILPGTVQIRLIIPQAFPTEPNNSIFSFTVALIASNPGARSLRGSKPFPS